MKERTPEQIQIRVWTAVIIRVLLIIAGATIVILVLYLLRDLLLLLVLSVFFCYMIAPIVRLFEQPIYLFGREIKLSRGFAILAVYVVFGVVLFLAVQLVLPILGQQLAALGKDLPNIISSGASSTRKTMQGADSWLRRLRLPAQTEEYLVGRATEVADAVFPWLRDRVVGVLGYLAYIPWLVLVPILSFFMLKDAEQFAEAAVALLPSQRLQRRANRLLVDVSKTMAAYIRAQVTACIVVGTLATGGLMIIGVEYAVVLGVIAGIMEFIPMIGPLIAIAAAFGLGLVTSVKTAFLALTFMLILRLAEDYFIYPRIVGKGIKMHPLVIVIAILCGAELDGVIGIFLAIPILGLFIVTYHHYILYKRMLELGVATGDLVPPSDPGAAAD